MPLSCLKLWCFLIRFRIKSKLHDPKGPTRSGPGLPSDPWPLSWSPATPASFLSLQLEISLLLVLKLSTSCASLWNAFSSFSHRPDLSSHVTSSEVTSPSTAPPCDSVDPASRHPNAPFLTEESSLHLWQNTETSCILKVKISQQKDPPCLPVGQTQGPLYRL